MKKIKKIKKNLQSESGSEELLYCNCGCGQKVSKAGNKYRLGHNRKRSVSDSSAKARLWKKGQSGNPAGRAVGSRNKVTIAAQHLLCNEEQALTRRLIDSAHNGNFPALKLCIERLVPVRKDVPISISLPKCNSLSNAEELTSSILNNISAGTITLSEGVSLSNIIDKHVRTLQLTDLESRLVQLEETLSSE